MKIKSLEIKNIRNIKYKKIDFHKNNIIIGKNATGKTTIAECIYFCCFYKSFRTVKQEEILNFEESSGFIKLSYEEKNIDNLIEIYLTKKEKKYFYNKKEIKDLYEIINKIHCIIIRPNNIDLIEDSPQKRRKYLNMLLSQYDINYLKILINYNKLIKIKKLLFKKYYETNNIDLDYISIINNKIFEYDKYIKEQRKKILTILEKEINIILKYITSNEEQVIITYNEVLEKKETDDIIQLELAKKKILKGNHLDDFDFILNENIAKKYASQGQKRLLTLTFFLAQKNIYKKENILIFDDVSIDLDKTRQEKLLKYLDGTNQNIYIVTDILKVFLKEKENLNIINMI